MAGPAVRLGPGSAEAKPAETLDKTTQRVECGPPVVWHARIEVVEQPQDPSRDIRRDLRKRDDLVKSGGDVVPLPRQHQVYLSAGRRCSRRT
jgi:hypothetical protein